MLNTGKLAGKTLYITGASRGIGKAIALKAAKDGAKIVVAAKTAEPHPKLPGTIFTAAEEIEKAGGQAFPVVVDVRDEANVQNSVEEAVKKFGGLDIVINNASAISLTGTQETSMKKYDLMNSINARGTYLVSKCAVPYLKDSKNNPHILNISPPLNMNPLWFKNHVAYTMAKYGMSMCVLGMAKEFKDYHVAVNALWPKTGIITAAMEMLGGSDIGSQCRKTDIMADAAYVMLTRDSKTFTGNFSIDEEILKEEGVKDFEQYAVKPGHPLIPDFFLDIDETPSKTAGNGNNVKVGARGYHTYAGELKPATAFMTGKLKLSGDLSKAMALEAVMKASRGESSFHTSATQYKQTFTTVPEVFEKIGTVANSEIVNKVKAVYTFDVEGDKYFIDLKNGDGSVGEGEPPAGKPDVTIKMSSDNFIKMFNRELAPASAFMTGKIKVSGDLSKALTLESVMKAAADSEK